MLKKSLQILGMAALAGIVRAQAPLSNTTLTTSLTSYQTQVCVASAANVTLPSLAGGTSGSIFLINTEAMQVLSQGVTSLCFNVKRGAFASGFGMVAAPHGNGAKVWVLQPTISSGDPSRPISATAFLSNRPYQEFELIATPSLTAVSTASVTATAGKMYYGAIEVDTNALVSGACVLNGATAAGNIVVAIYDDTGTLLANSATAGTAQSGASQYQCVAFTSPIGLLGPSQYFVATQFSAGTATFQGYAAGGAHLSYPTGSLAGTFGTLTSPLSPLPTAFTASVGPLMVLY